MTKESKTKFHDNVLLIFVGHSSDADVEAQAIVEMEGKLQRDLEDFLTAKNDDCRLSSIRIWEWNSDASAKPGGQAVVITPELKRADIAVFVFKERVGEVTWIELQQCRERRNPSIPVIAMFPEKPSDSKRLTDPNYIKNWTELLQKKKELIQNWIDPLGKAVTPQKDYSDIPELQSIVHQKIKQSMAEILRDASKSNSENTPPLTGEKNEQPALIPPEYRDWIQEFHSTISFDQLDKKGEAILIQLLNVYIPLETSNPFYKRAMGEQNSVKEPANINIEELIGRVNCLLLLGNAGMGKTTLVKHLVNSVINGSGPLALNGYLPVLIFLKDLWLVYNEVFDPQHPKMIILEDLLPVYLKKIRCPLSLEVIQNFLAQEKALFLFDGLDEVPENLRENLVDLIFNFYCGYQRNRLLITGRPHGVVGKAQHCFGKYLQEINPLDLPKIEDYIRKWFWAVSQQDHDRTQETVEGILADIIEHLPIPVLTENPLLLTAICILYLVEKQLRIPEQRAELYERVVENLLWRRFHDPGNPGFEISVKAYLMSLAYHMQEKNWRTIDEYEARNILKEKFPRNQDEKEDLYFLRLNQLLGDIEPKCGLLKRLSSGAIEFIHLTFQEFLAAKYMVSLEKDYGSFLGQDWWEETLILYIGYINLNMQERSNKIVEKLLNDSEKRSRFWLLGAKALREFRPEKRAEAIVNLARERLLQLIGSNVDLRVRFEAGELLGALGDPRIKEDKMVLVKAGEFTRGSKDRDRSQPVSRIYVDDYWIGKYSVTNEEFKEFVNAGGYQKETWWSPEGLEWRKKARILKPLCWANHKWTRPNFPVVGVSWYETEAYIQWLREQTREDYRLPTEAEWEKAARGMDGRQYPWGDLWVETVCNFEKVFNRTSPVGIFLMGKSPYGCLDLAGNVWEWCADWFDENYYSISPKENPKGPDSGSSRIVRGGGWNDDAEHCATSMRGYVHPGVRSDLLGFRLVKVL